MEEKQIVELVRKAQDGNMEAFGEIYIMFSPQIKAIIDSIIHNTEESKDLMQTCFVSALENIGSLKEPEKIKKWLIRIAANKAKDFLKKKKPDLLTKDQEYVIDDIEEFNPETIPEQCVEAEERRQEVNEMLDTLSEDKKLCLLLFYKHNMSISEISEELGVSESAIKSRLSRARHDIAEEAEKRKKKGMPLFTVAPFTLVIFALKKAADASAASFAGSAAQSAVFAGVVSASGAGAAAAATGTAATAAATATTTTSTATGVAAKIAAFSIAQKVIIGVTATTLVTGSAVGAAVIAENNRKEKHTAAYVEEYTTLNEEKDAEHIGFEDENGTTAQTTESDSTDETSDVTETTTEKTTAETTTKRNIWDILFNNDNKEKTTRAKTTRKNTTKKQTTQKTVADKSTTKREEVTEKVTTKPSVTEPVTTTRATTTRATTTRVTTTRKPTTTRATTTRVTTTKKPTTTRVTTTKPTTTKVTTTKPTTTKATTTKATTTALQKATVSVLVYGIGAEATDRTYTLTFNPGESITANSIQSMLYDEYGVAAMVDEINVTAQAGASYSATAYA